MYVFASVLLLATASTSADPKIARDLPYVEPRNEKQTLDVYAPAEGKDHPVVVWIHGGGWEGGDKSEVPDRPARFVARNLMFVSVNYHLIGDKVTIHEMAAELAKAIRWSRDHAKDYGGDPKAMFVMGHSAGAQLAALLCTDDRYLKAEGMSLADIRGCVPVDGDTYDVPLQIATVEQKRKDAYNRKFGDEEHQIDLSPITHVAKDKHIPPVLILHVADHPETTLQSNTLVKKLQAAGYSAEAFPAVGKVHKTINEDLGKDDDLPTQALWAFMGGVLKK